MKIYTKTADGGLTSLFGGTRASKDDARIEAYGCVDELNSCLGVARSLRPRVDLDGVIQEIQNDLFVLGADLASPRSETSPEVPRIESSDAQRLEGHIDHYDDHPVSPHLKGICNTHRWDVARCGAMFLRDIECCLRAMQNKLYHTEIRTKVSRVSRSTLAGANENRDWRIYADFAQMLTHRKRSICW